jgi:hypothetical protein
LKALFEETEGVGTWVGVSRPELGQKDGFGFSEEGEHGVVARFAEVCGLSILFMGEKEA